MKRAGSWCSSWRRRASPPDMAGWLRRRAAALLLLVAAIAAPAAAQNAADKGRFDEGLFWRIERARVPASYIYGTIHLGAPCEIYPGEHVAERARNARMV